MQERDPNERVIVVDESQWAYGINGAWIAPDGKKCVMQFAKEQWGHTEFMEWVKTLPGSKAYNPLKEIAVINDGTRLPYGLRGKVRRKRDLIKMFKGFGAKLLFVRKVPAVTKETARV